ncbi:CdaR family transcriptional regulator [Marmoricola sp. Leaf446]|uniref:helix-turn-helix domain-containing protein n=1 Tax=Marmoricola sp. Leaf446 TaxID=1736379 RepID=UPI0006F2B0D9|nr:helix-turn-helix domain-containing protein [Marmoricola sp. Leaf446]KQT93529.1 CdaR family transcriptional regulator [Marmoricola sp. Leaf446]
MQELLGRIARLDPSASLGLRVIACFDELVVGRVNTRALLAAAASLAGCPAGFHQDRPARQVRVDPRGRVLPAAPGTPGRDSPLAHPDGATAFEPAPGLCVWLERDGEPLANDAIILERLALAVRIRQGLGHRDLDHRRELGLLVDADVGEEERCVAATAIGLDPHRRYRVAAAPLFAVWGTHPSGPEDVVATRHGPLHALVVPEEFGHLDASPAGLGVATDVAHLNHSFRTAVVALQLADPPTTPSVRADDYGGLVGLLADAAPDAHQPDADLLEDVAGHPWGRATLEAVLRSSSVRQAARTAGVHHSTMQSRVDSITETLGWDPFDGFGRTRLGTAYLVWRLRHSRVLDLPAPT